MLTQGKDDNEAGRKKDKQETANFIDCEYKTVRQKAFCQLYVLFYQKSDMDTYEVSVPLILMLILHRFHTLFYSQAATAPSLLVSFFLHQKCPRHILNNRQTGMYRNLLDTALNRREYQRFYCFVQTMEYSIVY